MYFKWRKKIGSLMVAFSIIAGTIMTTPVFAATESIEIILKDVTKDNETTLLGEAKIKVSVKVAAGNVTAVQTALKFSGDLKYKSIEFLQGENNPPVCFYIPPNAALANSTGKMLPSITTNSEGKFTFTDEETDLFILTFSGEPGGSVTVGLNNESSAGTYCQIDGNYVNAVSNANSSEDAIASSEDNSGVTAVVKLIMDKIDDFTISTGEGYADSKITLSVTNEDTGATINTVINTVSDLKGGHHDSNSSVPTFIVKNSVVAGDNYTVEVKGNGYVSYKKTNVDFSEPVVITNAEFVPGDVNSDGVINDLDKTAFEEIKNGEYSDYADFNRSGTVDKYDNIFGDTESGNDSGNSSGDSGSSGGSGGMGGSGGGGGGGAGGAGGTGGGAGGAVSDKDKETEKDTETETNNSDNEKTEIFTDLKNYDWAKESIYLLKEKGIISGISETEYAPQNNIKRGDFILILTRMLDIKDAFTENFADVTADSYYYNAIGAAKKAGIAQGSGDSFMPENTITRQDLITLSYRAFLAKGYITETDDMTSLDSFGDKESISDYALAPMASMVKSGIIQGSNGNVNPLGFATRAEVAVMCARLVGLIK